MKYNFQENLHFTKLERRGIFGLALLCLASLFAPKIYAMFQSEEKTDFSTFENEIARLSIPVEKETTNEIPTSYNYISKKRKTVIQPFAFDPNTVTNEQLLQMGFSQKLATTFIKYRTGIKGFTKKEQIQKLYGLSPANYQILEPYINIKVIPKEDTSESVTKPDFVKPTIELFNFDPNTVDKESLLNLGFRESTADRLLKYRNKGGTFRKKEDVSLIYGLSKEKYFELKPYIQIAKKEKPKNIAKPASTPKKKEQVSIDINKATVEEWELLYGIGPSLSKRVVKFRDKLGGFANIDQVSEVYGLPDSTYNNIKSKLVFSPVFRKIDINQASEEELKAHPYLKWQQAKVIINYRNNHGPYSTTDDLKKIRILEEELIQKLAPYLDFN